MNIYAFTIYVISAIDDTDDFDWSKIEDAIIEVFVIFVGIVAGIILWFCFIISVGIVGVFCVAYKLRHHKFSLS